MVLGGTDKRGLHFCAEQIASRDYAVASGWHRSRKDRNSGTGVDDVVYCAVVWAWNAQFVVLQSALESRWVGHVIEVRQDDRRVHEAELDMLDISTRKNCGDVNASGRDGMANGVMATNSARGLFGSAEPV